MPNDSTKLPPLRAVAQPNRIQASRCCAGEVHIAATRTLIARDDVYVRLFNYMPIHAQGLVSLDVHSKKP
jgi:hypothetical protein